MLFNKPKELMDYPEFRKLYKHYINCSNSYDFTEDFLTKINEKGMSKQELIALAGLTKEVKDKELQYKLYQILIEEMVILLVKE